MIPLFDPAKHEYRVNGRRLPSVTQLIKPLYDGSFDFVPEEVMEHKSQLGKAVHYACELHDKGTLDVSTVMGEVAPYFEAYLLFLKEHKPRWTLVEQPLASSSGFAGTPDRAGSVPEYDIDFSVVDIKTVASVSAAVGVQLAGYEKLIAENLKIDGTWRRLALQLRPDGKYRIHPFDHPDDRGCFYGLLAQHHWKAKYAK